MPGRIQKILNWVALKIIPVFSPAVEIFIEMRVLFETKVLLVFETAEIPKNFGQIRTLAKNLWRKIRY